MGLSLFDVLVVNDYKLRDLSGTQTAAIMNWVQDGGVLILGTGDRVDDTLAALRRSFWTILTERPISRISTWQKIYRSE